MILIHDTISKHLQIFFKLLPWLLFILFSLRQTSISLGFPSPFLSPFTRDCNAIHKNHSFIVFITIKTKEKPRADCRCTPTSTLTSSYGKEPPLHDIYVASLFLCCWLVGWKCIRSTPKYKNQLVLFHIYTRHLFYYRQCKCFILSSVFQMQTFVWFVL